MRVQHLVGLSRCVQVVKVSVTAKHQAGELSGSEGGREGGKKHNCTFGAVALQFVCVNFANVSVSVE